MNVFIENFISANGATFKSYVRKDMARVTIRLTDGSSLEASGKSYDSAMTKLLGMLSGNREDRKRARRDKRKIVESFLEEDEDLDQ